jgi:hypothetical protein
MTRAIKKKKNFVLVTDGRTTKAFCGLTIHVGILSVNVIIYASVTTTLTFIVLQVIYYHCYVILWLPAEQGEHTLSLQKTGMTTIFVWKVYVPLRPVNLGYRKTDRI